MKKILNFFPQVFIFFVWFIFSSPYFLKNLVPFPSRYQATFYSPWGDYLSFPGPPKNSAMPDLISQIYPWKHLVISGWSQLQIPLWNPYSFSGTPLLANYQSAVFTPFNLLFFPLPFIDAWSILVLLQPLLTGIFMYLFLRSLLVSKTGSLISAVSFMFCGFITTWMGYATLSYAILFLPLALFAIEKYFITLKKIYLLLLSLTIPLSFFSGHFQISLYFFLFTSIYLIFKIFSSKEKRRGVNAVIFLFFGMLLTMPQVLPSIEIYAQSFRSEIFQKIEVIPWQYLPTLLSPDFFGNPVTGNDWFGHYAEWNGFIGVIPLILAFYSLTKIKSAKTLFFLIFGVISLLIAFDTSLTGLIVFLKIPVLSTSAFSRIMVLFSFSFAVLAGFGFDLLLKDLDKKKFKKIIGLLSFFILIFIVLWSFVYLKIFLTDKTHIIARQNLILPTLIFFAFLGIVLISVFLKKKSLLLLLALLVAFDLLRFAIKWMPFEQKDLVFVKTPVISKLWEIQGRGRIIAGFGREGSSNYYKLPSVEGYDAVYVRRYGQFIASLKSGTLADSPRSIVNFPNDSFFAAKAANLLSIDFVVHKLSDGKNSWTFPYWLYPKQFVLVYKDKKYEIFKNRESFPNTFFVNSYTVRKNPQDILNTMFTESFDLRKEVVLEEEIADFSLEKDRGTAEILNKSLNKMEILTKSDANNLLFISNSFYPGWEAKIDGKKAKIYRANFTFQAVPIEKGTHKVELTYEPNTFKTGVMLAILGLLGIMVLASRTLTRKASFSS